MRGDDTLSAMRLAKQLAMLLVAAAVGSGVAEAQTTAFVGARVIDGTGKVHERATIVVRDGKIVQVGPDVSVPNGAERVDLAGLTVIPGFINAHGHITDVVGMRTDREAGATRENVLRQAQTYARYGVTTVFSLGDEPQPAFALRAEQSTVLDRARLFLAGPVVNGTSAETASAAADKTLALKPDVLKIRVDDNLGTSKKMPEAAWREAVRRAREAGLPLAAHIFYLADAKAILEAGARMIGHSVRDVPVDQEFISMMKSRDACYSPTLMREVSTFVYGSTPPWANDPFFLQGLGSSADAIKAQITDPARQAEVQASNAYKQGLRYKAALEVATRNLKTLSDNGVRIAMGTDTGPPGRFQGFFEHLELEMMVDAGLTPMQAIVSATGDAARCYGKEGQIGSIQPGALADFVVLRGNPLQDITATRTIHSVWIGGRKAF
jgi:imidazolonepropionase-like amidohydrolase